MDPDIEEESFFRSCLCLSMQYGSSGGWLVGRGTRQRMPSSQAAALEQKDREKE